MLPEKISRIVAVIALPAACVFAREAGAQGVLAVVSANSEVLGVYAESRGGTVIHNAQGYRLAADSATGKLVPIDIDIAGNTYGTQLLYGSLNCSGAAFVDTSGTGHAGGLIVPAGTRGLYYVAKNPLASTRTAGSAWTGSSCSAIPPSAFLTVPVEPNEPSETGVSSATFSAPLRLQPVPLSFLRRELRDGFESTCSATPIPAGLA